MASPSGHARGVSLWLVPGGAVREHLAQVIAELARRYGTQAFEPHVTLLGGLALPEREVLARARRLAPRLSALPVPLTTLDGSDEYFRCLFLRVEETEELLTAHALASEAFGCAPGAPLKPHLSLLYGRLTSDARRTVLAELAGRPPESFVAHRLQVVRTEGAPAEWRPLAAHTLG